MKEGFTNLVIILDKSGSMKGLEKDVIGGYNALIKEQKKDEGEVKVTTILFNTNVNFVYENENIKKVRTLKDEDYVVGGCTALLDAIGFAIKKVEEHYSSLEEKDRPEHTIFSIMTDGEENSSRYYSYPLIKKMIEELKEKGWDFLFQAANIDSFAEGRRLGVSREDVREFKATKEGIRCCMSQVAYMINDKKAQRRK